MSEKSFVPLVIPISICIILISLLVLSFRTQLKTIDPQPDATVDEVAMSIFQEEYAENSTIH